MILRARRLRHFAAIGGRFGSQKLPLSNEKDDSFVTFLAYRSQMCYSMLAVPDGGKTLPGSKKKGAAMELSSRSPASAGIRSWQWALLLLAAVPLFPEYCCFLLVAAAAGFAVHDVRARHARPPKLGYIGVLLLIYIAYTALSTLWSIKQTATLETAAMWLYLFMLYPIVRMTVTDRHRLNTLLLYLTVAAALVGAIGTAQYIIGTVTNTNPIRFWDPLDKIVYRLLPMEIGFTPYKLRACATFSNPNVLSEYLTAMLPVAIVFNTSVAPQRLRHFTHGCIIAIVSGILFSFSRGGYLALVAIMLATVLCNIPRRTKTVIAYAFAALLLIPNSVVARMMTVIPGISVGSEIIDSITRDDEDGKDGHHTGSGDRDLDDLINSGPDGAINARWHIWFSLLDDFRQRPIQGYGAGCAVTWALLRSHGIEAIHAHNIVLQFLVEGGIIAVAIMGLIALRILRLGLDLLLTPKDSRTFWMGFAVLGFAGAIFLQGLADYPLMTPKLVFDLILLLAVGERMAELYPVPRGIPLHARLRAAITGRRVPRSARERTV